MSEEKKRLLSRWDKVWVFIVALIIIYVILQKFGINMLEQTEEMELIQKPHKN